MHFTPRPRWLRIVSTAIVVLPVLRSPMISSRWPRPIGVIESMALIPVWRGSCTGLRPMMPGAWISMRRVPTFVSGPLPSTGLPRASTTRPRRPSPLGTERIWPVAFTVEPSRTAPPSPRTTAPIDSSSRFRARPRMPPSNSSSSFTPTPGRPATVAMPSPTSVTRPTWAASVEGEKPSRFFWRAAAMSAVLMVSSAISIRLLLRWLSDLERGLQLLEPGLHRTVDHRVAHLGADPAEHGRVDDHLQLHLLAGGRLECCREALLLVVGEGDGR